MQNFIKQSAVGSKVTMLTEKQKKH